MRAASGYVKIPASKSISMNDGNAAIFLKKWIRNETIIANFVLKGMAYKNIFAIISFVKMIFKYIETLS